MVVPIRSLASIRSSSPQKSMYHEPITLVKQSSAEVSDCSRRDESLPYGQGKLQVPMSAPNPTSSQRFHCRIRSGTGLTESIRSGSNAQWLKRGFKSVTRIPKTPLITALKAILLFKSVQAEEESILDAATVTSACHATWCVD